MKYSITKHYKRYSFDLLSKESVFLFLKTLGYEFVEYEDISHDDRDMETTIVIRICAIKDGEIGNPYRNEITQVFIKEFEKSLLALLINAREIVYGVTQKVNDSPL